MKSTNTSTSTPKLHVNSDVQYFALALSGSDRGGTTGKPFLALVLLRMKSQPVVVKVISTKNTTEVEMIPITTESTCMRAGEDEAGDYNYIKCCKSACYGVTLSIQTHRVHGTYPVKSNWLQLLPLLQYE